MSSKQNNVKAKFNLGIIYSLGKGVKVNMKKAIEYFEQASEGNIPQALCKLGVIYLCGQNYIEKNEMKAVELFEKAIKIDSFNKEALIYLSSIYKKGKITTKDIKRSSQLLKIAEQKYGLIPKIETKKNI